MQYGYLMLLLGILSLVFGVIALINFSFILGGILVFLFIFVIYGLKQFRQEERAVIELFGKYLYTLQPGLQWIFPFIMKIRAVISIWEIKISLFEQEIKIDFRDGSAVPKGAEAWVSIKTPDTRYGPSGKMGREMTGTERAIYNISNWRMAAKDLLENALRSFLNTLYIDEGITQARAGFDLRNSLPKEEQGRLEDTLARWGFDLRQVTIMDFDLEPELVKARGEIHRRKKQLLEAREERKIKSERIVGGFVDMLVKSTGLKKKEVQEKLRSDPELTAMIVDLVQRDMSINGKALTHIRVDGNNDLMSLIAAFQKLKK